MPICHFSDLHPADRVPFALGHHVALSASGAEVSTLARTWWVQPGLSGPPENVSVASGGLSPTASQPRWSLCWCLRLFEILQPCFSGTRIIYDRKFLLDRRNSPMAQTPPCHLPNIPGVTSPGALIEDSKVEVNNLNNLNNHDRKHAVGEGRGWEGGLSLFCRLEMLLHQSTTDVPL